MRQPVTKSREATGAAAAHDVLLAGDGHHPGADLPDDLRPEGELAQGLGIGNLLRSGPG